MKFINAKPGERYPQQYDGDWVAPKRKYYNMQCCDCGLVHKMEFRVIKQRGGRNIIIFRAWRNEKETARIRKKKKHKPV